MCKIVAYYRVSTAEQGRSGLGLDAQREAVRALCERRGWTVIAEHTEVESGKRNDRPELDAALRRAKVSGAILCIAKLDRLSRSVAFLATLQDSGARFVAADMPEADETMVHVMAAFAQRERKAISSRTREALAAAKARGVKLGNPNGSAPLRRAGKGNSAAVAARAQAAGQFARDRAQDVREVRAVGARTLREIAAGLNARGITTPNGGPWHATSVSRLLARLNA
jgi:DNA invertase Pin-like site-specific DNA recombinase